ncbi:MAG: hypothetical protein M3R46_03620 [Actinomycetota bacterium]|nr:hypothetical protein [Actinomycetota bacterium]
MRIENCAALVVGGASGLGEATSRALHERGAAVTVADLDPDRGRRWPTSWADGRASWPPT